MIFAMDETFCIAVGVVMFIMTRERITVLVKIILGAVHISAEAKKAHYGTPPLADTMLTFSWDPPLADSPRTSNVERKNFGPFR